jgi:aminoglycoside phosphotransferase (APT) family kinase protein
VSERDDGFEIGDTYAAAREARRFTEADLVARLTPWLAERMGVADLALHDPIVPQGAGTSSQTVLVSATWREAGTDRGRDLVLRVEPDTYQLFLEPDFSIQYRALEALHREGRVKVPEPLFFEADRSLLGLQFFVMERVHGRVPVTSPPYMGEGWLFDATPDQRREAWETAMEQLCLIARSPLTNHGYLRPTGGGTTGLDRQWGYWLRSFDWVLGSEPAPQFSRLRDWLTAHYPASRPDGFSWGDARMGNMLFDPEFRCAGVVDWEQVSDGGIRKDLAWWLFFDRFHTEGRGLARLDGLGDRAEAIALWEDVLDEEAGDLTWLEAFAGLQVAILSERTFDLMGFADRTPDLNPALSLALDCAGLPRGA